MSINRGIEKEVVVRIHSGILEGNTSESVLMKWLNIELVIQNEVSQKEKNKSLVLMHIYMCVLIYTICFDSIVLTRTSLLTEAGIIYDIHFTILKAAYNFI